jgi:hypothetical protein
MSIQKVTSADDDSNPEGIPGSPSAMGGERRRNAWAIRSLLLRTAGVSLMAKTGKQDTPLSDKEALKLAETTDVSPKQAKDLAAKHGKEGAKKEAKNYKAEG